MADKEVTVKVVARADDSEVQALEHTIESLKKQKIDLKINSNLNEISVIDEKIARIKSEIQSLSNTEFDVRANATQINELVNKIDKLEAKKIDLTMDIEKAKLDEVKSEIKALENEEIEIQLRNQSAMQALDQISQGFDRLKQGASEVGQEMLGLLESAGKQETNKAFLTQAVGDADTARKKLEDINKVVQTLPGDDSVLQGLLGQAVAKDASLTTDQLTEMGGAAADYFSAMENFGKSSSEAFQDMNNYLLTGQTAEIERSPILANHIDKLKEGTTIQERSKLLQEALNEEHWGGISRQETYNNKLQTFEGMLERGRYNLGGMFQEGAKGAMDFIMQLDNASGGLVGMGIALGGFASPLTDTLMGLGQMATGFKAIKDLGIISWFKELSLVQKIYEVVTSALIPVQYAEGTAGWFSIGWIAVAIAAGIALGLALLWLYNNCDWFRQGVDNLANSLAWIASVIWGSITGALSWLSNLFQSFTSQLGLNTNDWTQAIIGFILFIPTLPLQIGIALANALAKALGFKGNFVQTLWQTAMDAVNKFADAIRGIGTAIQNCLDWAYNIFMSHPIVQAAVWLGQAIANGFSALGLGQNSPGKIVHAMEDELNWTEDAINNSNLVRTSSRLGSDISESFNPKLNANITSNNGDNGVGQVNNFYFNDTVVDNEDRMERICDYITRKIAWNNETAGRSV